MLKVHLKGITLQWAISLFVLLFPWNHSSCGPGHKPAFLLLYSTVSECIACVCGWENARGEKTEICTGAVYMHAYFGAHYVYVDLPVCICGSLYIHACVCVCMYACMHVSSSYNAVPHSARHSMYSSALLIAGCWSKIIVIFQPVGLKSYNIMKCIKKRGKWQTGGMLNQM